MVRAAALLIVLAGCTSAAVYSSAPMQQADRDTRYAIEVTPAGFVLSIKYSRYQFIPETEAVVTACKSELTSLAYELADRQRHPIKAINEQRIRLSTGRNGALGITSCAATVPVEFR